MVQGSVLSLLIMLWAALSSWWMLSSAVLVLRYWRKTIPKFLRMTFVSLWDIGCAEYTAGMTWLHKMGFDLWISSSRGRPLPTCPRRQLISWTIIPWMAWWLPLLHLFQPHPPTSFSSSLSFPVSVFLSLWPSLPLPVCLPFSLSLSVSPYSS